MKALWAACLAMLVAAAALADTAREVVADPALEVRVNRLAAELRCLVCQNQSLADSHAPLAIDLKNQVREQLAAGRSERAGDRLHDAALRRLRALPAAVEGRARCCCGPGRRCCCCSGPRSSGAACSVRNGLPRPRRCQQPIRRAQINCWLATRARGLDPGPGGQVTAV
jgi:hypothetical protein